MSIYINAIVHKLFDNGIPSSKWLWANDWFWARETMAGKMALNSIHSGQEIERLPWLLSLHNDASTISQEQSKNSSLARLVEEIFGNGRTYLVQAEGIDTRRNLGWISSTKDCMFNEWVLIASDVGNDNIVRCRFVVHCAELGLVYRTVLFLA